MCVNNQISLWDVPQAHGSIPCPGSGGILCTRGSFVPSKGCPGLAGPWLSGLIPGTFLCHPHHSFFFFPLHFGPVCPSVDVLVWMKEKVGRVEVQDVGSRTRQMAALLMGLLHLSHRERDLSLSPLLKAHWFFIPAGFVCFWTTAVLLSLDAEPFTGLHISLVFWYLLV